MHCLQETAGVKVAAKRHPRRGRLASALLFVFQWLGIVTGEVLLLAEEDIQVYGDGCSKLLCCPRDVAHVIRACGELLVAVVVVCSAFELGEVAHRCKYAGLRW